MRHYLQAEGCAESRIKHLTISCECYIRCLIFSVLLNMDKFITTLLDPSTSRTDKNKTINRLYVGEYLQLLSKESMVPVKPFWHLNSEHPVEIDTLLEFLEGKLNFCHEEQVTFA